jgi:hypothetical protein
MGRTQAELIAWSARVRAEAAATRDRARVTRSSAQEIRSRRGTGARATATRPQRPGLAVMIEDHVPLEVAAEHALMLDLTAREIADRLGVPVEYVLRAARERAAYLSAPVEDTLRSWFRALLASRSDGER